jgi:hypothetical protein
VLPENIRKRKIEGLEQILRNMKNLAAEWQREAEQPAAQSHNRFPFICIRFIVQLTEE